MRKDLLDSLGNQDWLYQKYIIEHYSTESLGRHLKCNPRTVAYWLRKHDIKVRDPRRPSPASYQFQDRDWLYNEYITKEQSMRSIERALGCSHNTLRKWLIYHAIPIRPKHIVIHNAQKGKDHSGSNSPSWTGGKAICIDCEKRLTHYVHGSRCWGCFKAWHRGENHRSWIPPEKRVTGESKHARRTIDFKDWRKAVFKRDDYICQKCQRRSKAGQRIKLHPHHIESFAKAKERRYEVSNGVTFCEECHRVFHQRYGFGDNHMEQLEKFLAEVA